MLISESENALAYYSKTLISEKFSFIATKKNISIYFLKTPFKTIRAQQPETHKSIAIC
jgi:hypothetical protein